MVKNPPSNSGDVGSILGWGTKIPDVTTRESLLGNNNDPGQPKLNK